MIKEHELTKISRKYIDAIEAQHKKHPPEEGTFFTVGLKVMILTYQGEVQSLLEEKGLFTCE